MAGLDAALAPVTKWISDNLLIDTVRITLPPTGDPVLNPTTGQNEYPDGDVLYEGPGAVQGSSTQPDFMPVADAVLPWARETKSRFRLLTPLTAPIAPKDAIVTVMGAHDPTRPDLLGRSWICQDPGQASTVEVVRVTPMDQQRAAGEEVSP